MQNKDGIMTNFEKRIKSLTVDKLVELEEDVLECNRCYCYDYCMTRQSDNSTCFEVRKDWLLQKVD